MPEVNIEVAGRSYRLGCGEGEEAHVEALAARIDTEATALAKQLGQVTEGRLLLMTALMLADKLVEAEATATIARRDAADAKTAADAARSAADTATREADAARALAEATPQSTDMLDPDRDARIAANLDALAERIEALAGQVEQTA